ncbi:MAG: outer membrane protein assembly factor BamE [Rhodobacteraceae bacterium]|nr:outer membrane protein assembly factor BamE [Paracoccaceae bacterium]
MDFTLYRRKAALALAILALSATAACTSVFRNHGFVPPPEDLASVTPGVTTRDEAAQIIGRPSSTGVLTGGGWYYVQSRWKHYAWREPEEVERKVLAVTFQEGVVANVETYGLQDGRVVPLSRRVTDSNVADISIIKQLFGNIGTLSADQITGG